MSRRKQRPGSGSSRRDEPETVDLLEIDGRGETGSLIELDSTGRNRATIKVVGVGGGGGNAVNNMIEAGLQGVEFVVANTDAQALEFNRAPHKMQLGGELTRGLGCGADPDKGRSSALEVRDRLFDLLTGTDMVFVTAGLGGGTGTGAAPVIAEVAREVGALTVGVVTKPFVFEGRVRMKHAEHGLDDLQRVVDTVITIPNQRLLGLAGKGTAMQDAFRLADAVLFNAVRGISDLITIHGLINLDFADVRTIMNEMGVVLMGTGVATGEDRGTEAAEAAISSPLLEDLSIEGARGVLINVTGGSDLTLYEVNQASTLIQEAAHEDANIIFGAVVDEDMPEGEMRVTVIATGLEGDRFGRGRDLSPRLMEDSPNVTPLRRETRPVSEPAPPAAEQTRQPVSASPPQQPARPSAGDELFSPFPEDELDVPTFIRRGGGGDEEDDSDEPAFLRRSAD
jgi:cell division protein FtsZ